MNNSNQKSGKLDGSSPNTTHSWADWIYLCPRRNVHKTLKAPIYSIAKKKKKIKKKKRSLIEVNQPTKA